AAVSTGRTFVYLSRNFGSEGTPTIVNASPTPLAQFGYSVVAVGDLDGDGNFDFAVGSPADGSGLVCQISGRITPHIIGTIRGPDLKGSGFGRACSTASILAAVSATPCAELLAVDVNQLNVRWESC